MTSTPDAPDDATPVPEAAEDEFALPRVRRSTYTPPPQYRELLVERQSEPGPGPDAEPAAAPEAPAPDPEAPDAPRPPAAPERPEAPPVEPGPEREPEPAPETPTFTPPFDPPPVTGEPGAEAPAFFALPLEDDTPGPETDHRVYPVDGSLAAAPPPAWNPSQWAPPVAEPAQNLFAMPAAAPIPEPAGDDAEQPAAPPVWSLDDEPEPLPEPHEPYRPWTPEPPAPPAATGYAQTSSWEALFPTSPPPRYPVGEPETETAPAPAPVPEPVPEPVSDSEPTPEPTPEPASAPVPEPHDEAATLAAHAPPAGRPWIPQRRSLSDAELLDVLEAADSRPGGTLDAMDALENEMRIREEEVQEYREWEDSMLAVGTPEALAVVAQVRPEFSAIVIPVELTPTSAITVIPPEPAPTDASAAAAETAPVAETAPDAPDDSADLPAPGFDDLLVAQTDEQPVEEPRRPFGVAVDSDGDPSTPLFSLELSGEEPTPLELRTGRAARMFWLWFAANSSIVSVGFGAMVFSLGMSLRQSIVAILAGVALSFLPLGLGTLAGKRSGQPTVVVSRAAFGLAGNILPAVLALVSRVFWGSVLLWLFASSMATAAGSGGSTAGLVIVFIVVGVMVAVFFAFVGFALLATFQAVASVASGVLVAGFVVLTRDRVDVATALTVADGPWVLVVTGAVLVFSFVGLVWANSSSDLARYQRPGSAGSTNMLWATFGTALPAFVLIGYGALLAASDPQLAAGLVSQPITALVDVLPGWYAGALLTATGLSLLSGVIITIYSGAFALQGIGLRVERQWATLAVGTLIAVVAVGLSVLEIDLGGVFRDLSTTLAVPIAAWLGVFAADTMIRNRRLHAPSLLAPGGVYPTVNWVNLSALVAITVVGWGLTTAEVGGLEWQGYGFLVAGVPLGGDLAASDLGVLVALVLGLAVPLVSGVPTIRRQEAAGRPN